MNIISACFMEIFFNETSYKDAVHQGVKKNTTSFSHIRFIDSINTWKHLQTPGKIRPLILILWKNFLKLSHFLNDFLSLNDCDLSLHLSIFEFLILFDFFFFAIVNSFKETLKVKKELQSDIYHLQSYSLIHRFYFLLMNIIFLFIIYSYFIKGLIQTSGKALSLMLILRKNFFSYLVCILLF